MTSELSSFNVHRPIKEKMKKERDAIEATTTTTATTTEEIEPSSSKAKRPHRRHKSTDGSGYYFIRRKESEEDKEKKVSESPAKDSSNNNNNVGDSKKSRSRVKPSRSHSSDNLSAIFARPPPQQHTPLRNKSSETFDFMRAAHQSSPNLSFNPSDLDMEGSSPELLSPRRSRRSKPRQLYGSGGQHTYSQSLGGMDDLVLEDDEQPPQPSPRQAKSPRSPNLPDSRHLPPPQIITLPPAPISPRQTVARSRRAPTRHHSSDDIAKVMVRMQQQQEQRRNLVEAVNSLGDQNLSGTARPGLGEKQKNGLSALQRQAPKKPNPAEKKTSRRMGMEPPKNGDGLFKGGGVGSGSIFGSGRKGVGRTKSGGF